MAWEAISNSLTASIRLMDVWALPSRYMYGFIFPDLPSWLAGRLMFCSANLVNAWRNGTKGVLMAESLPRNVFLSQMLRHEYACGRRPGSLSVLSRCDRRAAGICLSCTIKECAPLFKLSYAVGGVLGVNWKEFKSATWKWKTPRR